MSSTSELVNRGLQAQRRATVVWTVALLLLAASVVSVWPSMEESGSLDSLSSGLSPDVAAAFGLDQIATASGYLRGNLYAVLLPLLLGLMALTAATSLTAGDEEAGRLELLLALPVRRRTVFLTRLLTVVVSLAVVSVLVGLLVAGWVAALDMDVSTTGVAAGTTATSLLAALHACLAYAAACSGLSRSATMAVAGGVLVLGYLLHAIAPLSSALEPLAVVSPWEWALGSNPLETGFDPVGLLALLVASVVVTAVGTALVERRDVRTA
ncbi:ABC-2 type transport system permease protein [Nocardioides zeae]|uniref:ABC-2 type transport system permease protein n=2 Tax=Nocardioides zeae TaxID=1457234 RepID=A0AAJ1U420_9ACTN|nr:ABC transporter permease subunit [Nocardioides zeae]MDQ1104111.1 ABC-2 type transport system permease protein [Nocardioides zeae]MDR6176198.1 ABC-2 type transport system permease protein [Nocardioides zeae]MDR6210344.1 ABC-2 type transport system permease protein [Nocardioides zeae]